MARRSSGSAATADQPLLEACANRTQSLTVKLASARGTPRGREFFELTCSARSTPGRQPSSMARAASCSAARGACRNGLAGCLPALGDRPAALVGQRLAGPRPECLFAPARWADAGCVLGARRDGRVGASLGAPRAGPWWARIHRACHVLFITCASATLAEPHPRHTPVMSLTNRSSDLRCCPPTTANRQPSARYAREQHGRHEPDSGGQGYKRASVLERLRHHCVGEHGKDATRRQCQDGADHVGRQPAQ